MEEDFKCLDDEEEKLREENLELRQEIIKKINLLINNEIELEKLCNQ